MDILVDRGEAPNTEELVEALGVYLKAVLFLLPRGMVEFTPDILKVVKASPEQVRVMQAEDGTVIIHLADKDGRPVVWEPTPKKG